jgi:hypothetical protein
MSTATLCPWCFTVILEEMLEEEFSAYRNEVLDLPCFC